MGALVGTARFWSGHFFAPMGASLRPFIAPILLAACATFWSASAYAQANTTTSVTSSLNPSVFGQPVTFTATISPVAPGTGTPTGTVTFFDEVGPIAIAALSGGVATFTTAALAAGVHTITTSYGGDGNFNGSTGSLTGNPQVVNKANTATSVTSSVNPEVFGQSVTLTATVSPVAPGTGTPTGTVTFLDGGSPIGTGTLSVGVATFTTAALAAGNHTITTSYGGDGNFNGSTGSLTGNPQVVNKANTTTSVTSSANPDVFGQSITFTATVFPVSPAAGSPTGTVTFLDGGSPIGTGTLSGGVATFATAALAVGNHIITTSYGGDGNFNGSMGSLTGNPQVVNKANTTTAVTSSANPSGPGQSVTFTATVSPVAPGSGTPDGHRDLPRQWQSDRHRNAVRRCRHLRDLGACGWQSHHHDELRRRRKLQRQYGLLDRKSAGREQSEYDHQCGFLG